MYSSVALIASVSGPDEQDEITKANGTSNKMDFFITLRSRIPSRESINFLN